MKALYVLVSLLLIPLASARTITIQGTPQQTGGLLPVVAFDNLSPRQVTTFVRQEAIRYGVNPTDAEWIVGHESEDCWQKGYYDPAIAGHETNGTISYGCWQFNDANDHFNLGCATDLKCSTDMAMQWILEGQINKWSTWRFRCTWYAAQSPPDCD
jgi:hypothetical protein